tara:strand:+ start:1583 stop:2794 length:1212 start_codon:yes stop_codon:yes gene_type:complete
MLNQNLKFNNYNLYIITLYILWIIAIISYFFFDDYVKAGSLEEGVKLGNDSYFYLKEVANIIDGKTSIIDYKSKFGYLLFLLPFVYFKIPLIFIVYTQIFLTGFAAWCLYRISTKYFCKLSGIICLALFLFYFPLQIRNFYILTEMLFIDISIIIIYFLSYFKRAYLPLIILLIIVLISIRPNGILFFFSILISLFIFLYRNKKYLYFSVYLVISISLLFPIINLLNSYLVDLDLIKSLNTRGIIWGWSFKHNQICENNGIPCLEIEFINNNYQNNLFDILKFIYINFFEFSKIFFLKVFWLLARVRPFYSDLHNYYIIFFNLILYTAAIYGLLKKPKNNFSINVILFFIFFSICLVGLTFADWSGRFSLNFFPLIMIFSSYGILIFIKKIFNLTIKNERSSY